MGRQLHKRRHAWQRGDAGQLLEPAKNEAEARRPQHDARRCPVPLESGHVVCRFNKQCVRSRQASCNGQAQLISSELGAAGEDFSGPSKTSVNLASTVSRATKDETRTSTKSCGFLRRSDRTPGGITSPMRRFYPPRTPSANVRPHAGVSLLRLDHPDHRARLVADAVDARAGTIPERHLEAVMPRQGDGQHNTVNAAC